jgi:hypothetical protein
MPCGSFWKVQALNRGQLERCAFETTTLSKQLRRHRLVFNPFLCLCYMMNAAGAIRRQPLFAFWLAMLTRQLYNLLISETPHHSTLVSE